MCKKFIYVFRRLVATSRAPQIMVSSMLRSFGKIGPQIDQIWAWLSRGHQWSPGVRNPLKYCIIFEAKPPPPKQDEILMLSENLS